jgi:hypothetical protein
MYFFAAEVADPDAPLTVALPDRSKPRSTGPVTTQASL